MARWLSFLEEATRQGASDVFFSTGNPPVMRVQGALKVSVDEPVLSCEDVSASLHAMMSEQQRRQFSDSADLDFAFEAANLGRFRVNAFQHHNGPGAVLRILAQSPPALEQLILGDPTAKSVLISWAEPVACERCSKLLRI